MHNLECSAIEIYGNEHGIYALQLAIPYQAKYRRGRIKDWGRELTRPCYNSAPAPEDETTMQYNISSLWTCASIIRLAAGR